MRPIQIIACWLLAFAFILVSSDAYAQRGRGKKGKKEEKKQEVIEPQESTEETICETDVYYTWKKFVKKNKLAKAKTNVPEPKPSPIDVFYSKTGENGAGETDAKKRLMLKLPKVKADAIKQCKKDHQERAICVAQQLKRSSDSYHRLDFAARKAILEAATEDCSEQSGDCLSARAMNLICYPVATPDSSQQKTEDAQADAKDTKKK